QQTEHNTHARKIEPVRASLCFAEQHEKRGEEKKIQACLLDQTVKKNRRRIEDQNYSSANAGTTRKKHLSSPEYQRAGKSAQCRLDDTNQEKIVAEDRLKQTEKVRIERSLKKNPLTQQIAGGDLLRPLIIGKRI